MNEEYFHGLAEIMAAHAELKKFSDYARQASIQRLRDDITRGNVGLNTALEEHEWRLDLIAMAGDREAIRHWLDASSRRREWASTIPELRHRGLFSDNDFGYIK